MDPSQADISWGWALAFALAAITLVVLYVLVPRSEKLWVGRDNRTSTSKTQVLLWTYAVLLAIWALFYGWLIVTVGDAIGWSWAERIEDPLKTSFDAFLDDGLDETYLLLLGFPAGAAIAAKALTTSKVQSGDVVKTPKPEGSKETGRAHELVSDDEGAADLGDYQYVLFNALAIAYFLAQFIANPHEGLPDMPDTLIGLTGVAAAAYVAKKGIYSNPPILLSVDPPEAASGDTVTLYGEALHRAPDDGEVTDPAESSKPRVLFGNTPARPSSINSEGTCLEVEVPRRLKPGATKLTVVRPPGARSEPLEFEIVKAAPTIVSVVPMVIRFGSTERLRVVGTDFFGGRGESTQRNAVTLGGHRLEVEEGAWHDDRVRVGLPSLAEAEELELNQDAKVDLVVYDAKGRPSEPFQLTVQRRT